METFSASLSRCAGNSPVNSPHKSQWRGALMFSLICAWTNAWVNNRNAGDLRRRHAYYDVTVINLHIKGRLYLITIIYVVLHSGCANQSRIRRYNNSDVIMSAMASWITGASILCAAVSSCADQRQHQSSASLAFVRGIQRSPVDSAHKRPGTRKCFHLMTL